MEKWSLSFTPEAEDDLAKLDREIKRRIIEKLDWLQANFKQMRPLPLGDEWRGFFKLRIGDWRVIYEIVQKEKIIKIRVIDHRSKIYKRKLF
jgi:mRNA interferase RelE/StbE